MDLDSLSNHPLALALQQRILILDGAMGTMIQAEGLEEADYRGERFDAHPADLKGNNDLLSLTRPDIVARIHRRYLEAGADIIGTNTFNSTAVAQGDYDLSALAAELNLAGARIARQVADELSAREPEKPRFVAGILGPTPRTASISPDVNDPGARNIYFAELQEDYAAATRALIEGGVDLILIETVFDTLNAKAAIFAAFEVFDKIGHRLPLMISGTITDASGRTLSGQTPTAFWHSVSHARPFTVGLNCALGAEAMRPHIAELAGMADTLTCAYPNAGLPNAFGGYDETPEKTAAQVGGFARDGLVNVVGGCCGTTPDHIRAIADAVAPHSPRKVPA